MDVKWLDLSVTYLICSVSGIISHTTRPDNRTDLSSVMDNRQWMEGKDEGVLDWRERREHGVQSNPGFVCSANGMEKNERMPSRAAMAELNWSEMYSFRKGTNNFSIQGNIPNLNRVPSYLEKIQKLKAIGHRRGGGLCKIFTFYLVWFGTFCTPGYGFFLLRKWMRENEQKSAWLGEMTSMREAWKA